LHVVVSRRFPRIVHSRWNFNSRLVCTVYENREELAECMDEILAYGNFDSIGLTKAFGV
jgi:hypothetical protein